MSLDSWNEEASGLIDRWESGDLSHRQLLREAKSIAKALRGRRVTGQRYSWDGRVLLEASGSAVCRRRQELSEALSSLMLASHERLKEIDGAEPRLRVVPESL